MDAEKVCEEGPCPRHCRGGDDDPEENPCHSQAPGKPARAEKVVGKCNDGYRDHHHVENRGPRLSIWEDACLDGLIEYECGPGKVTLSSTGRALLASP